MKYCNIGMVPVLMALMVCSGSSFAADTNVDGSLSVPEADQPAIRSHGLTRARVRAELVEAQALDLIGRDHNTYPQSLIDHTERGGGHLTRAQVQAELEQAQARGLIGHDHSNYPRSIPDEPAQKIAEPERALPPLRMESDSHIYDHS